MKNDFIERQIMHAKANFEKIKLNANVVENIYDNLNKHINKEKIFALICDFNPILNKNFKNFDCDIYEIDGQNVVSARFISDKQEYSARTFRRKFYLHVNKFLTEFDNNEIQNNLNKTEAELALDDFIKNKLKNYAKYRNDPTKNVQSSMSNYLNLGFISPQRVALEIIKSNEDDENKEAYLEELLIRRELADNFCLHCKNFKSFDCLYDWSKASLNAIEKSFKPNLYGFDDFLNAKTKDVLWNAAQNQLLSRGKIHGYLRMYWAKQLLLWTLSPQIALETAIKLNDTFSFDAPSASGYTGILWSLAGLHDRPFRFRSDFAQIRPMTLSASKTKFDVNNIYMG